MKKNYHSNATENELKNGQRFLGIDKPQTSNPKLQTPNSKPQTPNNKQQTTNIKQQTTNNKLQTTLYFLNSLTPFSKIDNYFQIVKNKKLCKKNPSA
jgi:hypothetical protein